MRTINDFLQTLHERKGSDLHVIAEQEPADDPER